MKFALFFLGEYAAMIVASCLMVTLSSAAGACPSAATWRWKAIPGAYSSIPSSSCCKMCLLIVFFIWVRWTLPRFRYDQLMGLGWKCILPISLADILLTGILLAWVG